jgi:hypothetical protein
MPQLTNLPPQSLNLLSIGEKYMMLFKLRKKRLIFFVICIGVCLLFFTFFFKFASSSKAQTSPLPVTWTNLINATANANNIQHAGSSSGYFAKGQTTQTISGVGYFEFTFNGETCAIGLGNNNDESNNGSYNDLDFAFNFGTTNGFSIRLC